MLSPGTLEVFRGAWLQDPAVDPAGPMVSLLAADLEGLPSTTVHHGEWEVLADDGAAFAKRLAAAGVTSEIHPLAQCQHSFILGAGQVPEVDQAIDQMGKWLRRYLGT